MQQKCRLFKFTIYSSEKVSSPYCLKKKKKNDRILYYQQMLGAAIVHPDQRVVIINQADVSIIIFDFQIETFTGCFAHKQYVELWPSSM